MLLCLLVFLVTTTTLSFVKKSRHASTDAVQKQKWEKSHHKKHAMLVKISDKFFNQIILH